MGVFRGGSYYGHWLWPPSNQCADGGSESDWTMCAGGTLGHAYLQPLAPHDIDTVQNFY
jgi:hypothetical protein